MPIIQSAIKRAKQNTTRNERNSAVSSHMRSMIKNIIKWAKGGEVEKLEKTYPEAQKAIGMAAKRNLIHRNNAARKQALITKKMKEAGAKTTTKTTTKSKTVETTGTKKKTATTAKKKAA